MNGRKGKGKKKRKTCDGTDTKIFTFLPHINFVLLIGSSFESPPTTQFLFTVETMLQEIKMEFSYHESRRVK